MSVRVMADVWDFGPDDPIDNSVLLRLASHCNDQGQQCYPSVKEVALKVRRSERTVIRSIAQLEQDGWITVERGSGRETSRYIVNVSRFKELQLASLLKDKGCQPVTPEKTEGCQAVIPEVTAATTRGDSGDKPPHPLIGVNVSETSLKGQDVIPDFVDRDAWDGFVEMRKRMKWPLTGRATKSIFDKLKEIKFSGGNPNAALDQSTERCYRSVFEVKPIGGLFRQPKPDPMLRMKFINGGAR